MNDEACIDFLQWCLPKLDKRWEGFRKVRGQVCKQITRRMQELELRSVGTYRDYLDAYPEEWNRLDAMCRITISRFYRDRGVFDALRDPLLPDLAERLINQNQSTLRVWSAGCASGEEAYTLRMIWRHDLQEAFPDVTLHITATDAQVHMLERARRGCYPRGTLKELPDAWIEAAFEVRDENAEEPYCIRSEYQRHIDWLQQDIREAMPDGPFHLILCRNLAFTYFDADLQRTCLERILKHLTPGGFLILGKHESIPDGHWPLSPWDEHKRIYRRPVE